MLIQRTSGQPNFKAICLEVRQQVMQHKQHPSSFLESCSTTSLAERLRFGDGRILSYEAKPTDGKAAYPCLQSTKVWAKWTWKKHEDMARNNAKTIPKYLRSVASASAHPTSDIGWNLEGQANACVNTSHDKTQRLSSRLMKAKLSDRRLRSRTRAHERLRIEARRACSNLTIFGVAMSTWIMRTSRKGLR